MKKIILLISTLNLVYGQVERPVCGTPSIPQEQIEQIGSAVEDWSSQRDGDRNEMKMIFVAWHIVHATNGQGNYGDDVAYDAVAWLNETFAPHNFAFELDTITRTENDQWFGNWYSDVFQGAAALNIDPFHNMNVYTADLYSSGVAGFSYLANTFPAGDYRHSVNMDYRDLAYGNDVLTHEAGHHLGLPHTFSGSCNMDGDGVDDTPRHLDSQLWSCNDNLDSCPNDEGNDPVHNYMTYTNSSCQYEFTVGQEDYMHFCVENYHYGYLENNFGAPNLYVDALSFEEDTDEDGILNPGEQMKLYVDIGNAYDYNADSITMVISSENDFLFFIDNTIQFYESIGEGEVGSTDSDWFELYALPNIELGNVECNINITTSDTENPYEIDIPIQILVSLDQKGFPIDDIVIKSSPVIADLYGNNTKSIIFGSDDDNVYGYMIDGLEMFGFPYATGDDVRSSPAVADLDKNNSLELIIGSHDGSLHIISGFGQQLATHQVNGSINGSPAAVDLDQDGDLEVVFTSYNGGTGDVHAIHHNGSTFYGFPVYLNEKMVGGAAAGDLDGDGYPEIVVCTDDDNVYAIKKDGSIMTGFPFTSSDRFFNAPTLVDIDGDSDLEIIVGNRRGTLQVLHHDGTEMAFYEVGDDIRGGISVADLNDDGSYELLVTSYEDMIHVWNPIDGAELEGWPVDMGSNALTEPVTADLDNDGDLEVVAVTRSGMAYVFHHDATPYNNFPASLGGNVESSPAIGDIDGDGDFELVFGTTGGLKVIDIKEDMGERVSWKLHRGNLERTGSLGMTLVSNDSEEGLTPSEFYVSANYPNPFNPSTVIDIETVEAGDLMVSVFDAKGRVVNNLVNSYLEAGRYSVKWNGIDAGGASMPTGVYFIRVQSGLDMHTQKMILMK